MVHNDDALLLVAHAVLSRLRRSAGGLYRRAPWVACLRHAWALRGLDSGLKAVRLFTVGDRTNRVDYLRKYVFDMFRRFVV